HQEGPRQFLQTGFFHRQVVQSVPENIAEPQKGQGVGKLLEKENFQEILVNVITLGRDGETTVTVKINGVFPPNVKTLGSQGVIRVVHPNPVFPRILVIGFLNHGNLVLESLQIEGRPVHPSEGEKFQKSHQEKTPAEEGSFQAQPGKEEK